MERTAAFVAVGTGAVVELEEPEEPEAVEELDGGDKLELEPDVEEVVADAVNRVLATLA